MPRIRTVKPEFYRHEALQDLEAANPGMYVMLVFQALWGHCDKNGVFPWRPRSLKLDILPFLQFDLSASLVLLREAGMIKQYEVGGEGYGFIPSFKENQRISGKEAQDPARHPQPPVNMEENIGEETGTNEGSTRDGRKGIRKGREEEKETSSSSQFSLKHRGESVRGDFEEKPVDNSQTPQPADPPVIDVSKNFEKRRWDVRHHLSDWGWKEARYRAPGWDIDELAKQFNEGISNGKLEIPQHPNKAFPAWVFRKTNGLPPP